MIFNTVQDRFHVYYAQLPANTLPSMFRSALYSFSISFIIGGIDSRTIQLTRPLITAGVAGLATLIHALTNPFFNYIFENQRIKWHQEAIRFIIDVTATSLLVRQAAAFKVQELIFQKAAFWFMSTHVARLGIDLTISCIGALDEEAVTQARNWLGTWGIKFDTDDNPTYLVV